RAAGTASILWTIFTPRHTAVKTQARGTGILPMSRGIVPPTRSTPRAWGRDLPAAAGFKPVSVAGTTRDLNRLTTPLYPRRKAGTRADLFVVMLSRPADDTAAAAPAARRSGGNRDRAAAQDGVTVVEDRRLAPGDAAGGRPQPDPEQVAVEAHGSRMDLAVRAQLDQAVAFPAGRLASGPHRALRGDVGHIERLARADGDRPGRRLDVQHIPGPAVAGRGTDPQPLALSDGESVGTVMGAELGAVFRHDATGRAAQPAGQECPGVPVGDEADVVAVRLVRDRQPPRRRLGPDLLLRRPAEREQRQIQLPPVQHR